MSLIDNVKNFVGGILSHNPITGETASQIAVRTANKPETIFNTTNPVKVLMDVPVSEIDGALAGLISQSKAAPGTNLKADLSRILAFAGVEAAVGLAEELSPSVAFIMGALFNKLSEVMLASNWRDLEYQSNYSNPNRVTDIHETVSALFRGALSKEEAAIELQKEGYNAVQFDRLVAVSRELLGIGELINLRFRGEIKTDAQYYSDAEKLGYTKEEASKGLAGAQRLLEFVPSLEMWRRDIVPQGDTDAFDDLRRSGWTEARVDALKKASYTLPNIFNVQDFSVRQVRNPAIVEKFDLDHLRDDAYMLRAKQLGYSEQDAIDIYRYYWEYPPFFQIARLFTNGKIPEADFRDALGFLRFTPYWVDRLVADLKPAMTEAEVKDEYKYQVIRAADIVPELLKLGVTPELANRKAALWIASVKLAAPRDQTGAAAAAEKIKGDTLGLVVKAYKDHILSAADATAELEKVGYTADIIALELAIADYDSHQTTLREVVADAKANVTAGLLSTSDALTLIAASGADASQLDRYQAEFFKLTSHKPVQPTKAEFESWFKKGLISAQDLADGLGSLGISPTFLPFYLQVAGVPAAQLSSISM